MRALVALGLLGWLVAFAGAGCASSPRARAFGAGVATNCAGAVLAVGSDVVGQAVASMTDAPGAPSWAQFAAGDLISRGVVFGVCVVEQALAALDAKLPPSTPVTPTGRVLLSSLKDMTIAASCSSAPPPAVLVGHARGVDWLEAQGVIHVHGGGR